MDSMTLPELKANIRLVNTPEAETQVVDYIFDIHGWIEPFLNPIKYHAYPHAYKLTKINGQAVLKYKQKVQETTYSLNSPKAALHLSVKNQQKGWRSMG